MLCWTWKWDVVGNIYEVSPALSALAVTLDANVINEHLQQLERFVVLVYDRTSTNVAIS